MTRRSKEKPVGVWFCSALAVVFLGGVAVPIAARAAVAIARDPLIVALDFRIAAGIGGCPDQAMFERDVAAQLDYNPFRPDAGRRIVATVHAGVRVLEGEINWLGTDGHSEGERRFSSATADCAKFVKGMTFALAVQIQFVNLSGREPQPAPVAVPLPVAVSFAATPVAHDSMALGLGPIASLGSGPSISAGVRVRMAFRRDNFSFEMSGAADLPVSLRRSDGTGFSSHVFALGVSPCGHWRRLATCVLGTIERLQVQGLGLDEILSPSTLMAKTGFRLGLERAVSNRIEVTFFLDGLYTITPRTVIVSKLPVWTTPPLSFSVGFDLSALSHLRWR